MGYFHLKYGSHWAFISI